MACEPALFRVQSSAPTTGLCTGKPPLNLLKKASVLTSTSAPHSRLRGWDIGPVEGRRNETMEADEVAFGRHEVASMPLQSREIASSSISTNDFKKSDESDASSNLSLSLMILLFLSEKRVRKLVTFVTTTTNNTHVH